MSRPANSHLLKSIALSALMATAALHGHAASVTATTFSPGSGYGVDANEGTGTLLYVRFEGALPSQPFTLNQAGDSATIQVGNVQLLEPNAHGGINAAETNDLGVTASLIFSSPFEYLVQVYATGNATVGAASDSEADLTIDWTPQQVAFGSGGLLEISLNDLTFTGLQTLSQTATITLLSASGVRIASTVPEPGSLALIGAALAGLACGRRKRDVSPTTAMAGRASLPPPANP